MTVFKAKVIALLLIAFLNLHFTSSSVQAEHGLLWEIKHPEKAYTSYLFGTIHIQDHRVFNFSDSLKIVLESVDAVAVEALINNFDLSVMPYLMMEDTSLADLLDKNQLEVVNAALKENTGMPGELFLGFKPFFLLEMVMNTGFDQDSLLIQDMYFAEFAINQGKDVYELEGIKKQIKAIDQIPLKNQAELLYHTVTSNDSLYYIELLDFYLAERTDKLLDISESDTLIVDFLDVLNKKRNIEMLSVIKELTSEQSVFIAVGALHIPGEDGLVYLLRNEGYKLRAIHPALGR